MDLGLNNRVAVVTGGSMGIGFAIAEALAREGAQVVITARNQNTLDQAVSKIEKIGGIVSGFSADATVPEDAQNAINFAVKTYGKLDILINNVGGAINYGAFQELSISDWSKCFELNVLSMVNFVNAAEQHLLKGENKRIITISSIQAVQPGFFNPHYSAMKAATLNLSKHLSQIYADKGIRVSTVCPGPVVSDAWEKNIIKEAEDAGISYDQANIMIDERERAKIPLGRVGNGDDIGPLVAFLASDRADWITGSCFHVNGGKLAGFS